MATSLYAITDARTTGCANAAGLLSAIEVAEMYPRLLLLGERGAGKSVLAR